MTLSMVWNARMRVFIAISALFAVAESANAAPIFFTNEASFQAAAGSAGIVLQTETFNAFPNAGGLATNPVTANGITVSSDDSSSSLGPGVFGSQKSIAITTQSGGTSVIFTFANPVNAVGIDIFDLGINIPTTLTLTTTTGSQVLFNNFTGPIGNQQFGGVIDDATLFTSATFTNTAPGDFVEFDDLQFGRRTTVAVPEPASLALLGMALGALAWSRRRKNL